MIAVDAITGIRDNYQIKKNWASDPCLPELYPWEGVNCSYDNPKSPTITGLDLSNSGLQGSISSQFEELKSIQSLFTDCAGLSGVCTQELVRESLERKLIVGCNLRDLSDNDLHGPIPSALKARIDDGSLSVRSALRILSLSFSSLIESNCPMYRLNNICLDSSCEGTGHKSNVKLLVIAICVPIAFILIIIAIICIVLFNRRHRHTNMPEQHPTPDALNSFLSLLNDLHLKTVPVVPPSPIQVPKVPTAPSSPAPVPNVSVVPPPPVPGQENRFSYSDIVRITNNFQTEIGKGGCGTVYLGQLRNGRQVAIKKVTRTKALRSREFSAEIAALTQVHHRSLVSFYGFCDEGVHMMLVYEYMAGGNLRDLLSGLDYLHAGCNPPIIHRDVKTTNILLDGNMEARLADFGLSRAIYAENAHVSTLVAGTTGYIDPEYYSTGKLTTKSDVYSFGVVLFELLTGRPVFFSENGILTSVVKWGKTIIQYGDFHRIIDPKLRGQYDADSMWSVIELAIACLQESGDRRPTMQKIVTELGAARNQEIRRLGIGIPTAGEGLALSESSMEYTTYVETEAAPKPRFPLPPDMQPVAGRPTQKTDVYSFGFVLLELITGYPTPLLNDEEKTYLVFWAKEKIPKGHLEEIVDPRLEGQYNSCSNGRPTMREIVKKRKAAKDQEAYHLESTSSTSTAGFRPIQPTEVKPLSSTKFTSIGFEKQLDSGIPNDAPTIYRTLRYFPHYKRNCYSLPVTQDTNYLVRASFMYGNYDGTNTVPSFDLYLGVDLWDTVKLDNATHMYWTEILISATTETLSVCLVNTSMGVPFISGLELRPLEGINGYKVNATSSLVTFQRVDVGGTASVSHGSTDRFPDDRYDRIWTPSSSRYGAPVSTDATLGAEGKETRFGLPPAVMRTAVASSNSIVVTWSGPFDSYHSVLGFAGVLPSTGRRNLTVKLDGNHWYGPFSFDYRQLYTVYSRSPIQGAGQHSFTVEANDGSGYGPILNAFEVYRVVQPGGAATFPQDDNNRERRTSRASGKIRSFTYDEVVEITNNFERVIGKGGSCSVFYGRLSDGREVAVKVMTGKFSQGIKEYTAEVELLMKVHHKCLVSFIGFCDEDQKMILVYEYMKKGDLQMLLSDETGTSDILDWGQRLQIAHSVAIGLEYLHSGCRPSIIHRDVKTSNILLNDKLEAKLADFGLSKIRITEEISHVSTVVAGTPGYIDPEYYDTNQLTEKSDVYSFGVVLFVLITGRHSVFIQEFIQEAERLHIVKFVTAKIMDGDLSSIIDPRLQGQCHINSVCRVAETAIACTSGRGVTRPTMTEVVGELKAAMDVELRRMESKRQPMELESRLLSTGPAESDMDSFYHP
ncbi:Receptor-like protein kinase [Nymphaea thermarum]|nr:Receptor-like protein kinase [Nymphaea thermarum]